MIRLILIIIFLFSCATKKVPIWVKDFGKRSFSKDGIEGFGFAKFDKKDKSSLISAREIAYNEAIKNLAIKLKTQVRGEIEHRMEDKISYLGKKYEQQAFDKINSLTEVAFDTALGRKYFEEYIDYKNSLYWVYVWTTKKDLQQAILEELGKQEIKNTNILKSSILMVKNVDEIIYSGNILNAFNLLEETLKQLSEIKGVCVVDDVDNISLQSEIENKINNLLSSFKLYPLDPTNIEVPINQQLDLEINVRVELEFERKKIFVKNFPLMCKFLKGSGEIDKIVHTDSNGIAKFRVYKVNSKENVVEISPNIEEIRKYTSKFEFLSNLKVVFNIASKILKEKIYLDIKNLEGYEREFVKNEITAQLKNFGFNIADNVEKDVNYILVVSINLEDITNKVNFSKENVVCTYTSSASLDFKNLHTNIIVLSKSFIGINGFGRTKKEAEQNTLKKLSEIICEYIIKSF